MSVLPIRPDCVVQTDAVAELLSFVASELTQFAADDGDQPQAVVLYIRGEKTAGAAVMSHLSGLGLDEVCDLACARIRERALMMREEDD